MEQNLLKEKNEDGTMVLKPKSGDLLEEWREVTFKNGKTVKMNNITQVHVGKTTLRIFEETGLVHILYPEQIIRMVTKPMKL